MGALKTWVRFYKITRSKERIGFKLFEFRLSVGYVLAQVQSSKFKIVIEPVTLYDIQERQETATMNLKLDLTLLRGSLRIWKFP